MFAGATQWIDATTAVVPDKRGRNVRRVSTRPVLVGPEGEQRPFDLSLETTAAGFSPRRPFVPVSVPRTLADPIELSRAVQLHVLGVDTTVAGVRGAANSVVYANVAPDTDAVVTATTDGVEEDTILRSPASPERLEFGLTVPADTELRDSKTGGLEMWQAGSKVAEVAPLSAHDAQGVPVAVTMKRTASGFTAQVDHRSTDLAYPVTVDPRLTAIDVNRQQTGWFSANPQGTSPGKLFGAPGQPEIAWRWTMTNPSYAIQSMLLTDLHGEYVYPKDTNPYEWRSAITTFFGGCADPSDPTRFGYQPAIGISSTHVILLDDYNNKLRWDADGVGVVCPLLVKESLAPYGNATGPSLVTGDFIFSMVPLGPVDSEHYGPGSAAAPNVRECHSGDPVNCFSGNHYEQQVDLAIGGLGLGLVQARTYNALAAVKQTSGGTSGFGWSASYSDALVVDTVAKSAIVTQADGATVPFDLKSDGTFAAPAWVQATLAKIPTGGYRFTLPDRRVFTFNDMGVLVDERDANGNTTTIARDAQGRIVTVTDPAGRKLTYSYNAAGQLATVTDPINRVVAYGYSAAGDLTAVTLPDGAVWKFGYDASHRMTTKTDPRGGVVTTAYDSQHRAIAQSDQLGRQRTWSYGFVDGRPETVITEPNGSITDEVFNSSGEPMKITRAAGKPEQTIRYFAYDAAGALVGESHEGHNWAYEYDTAGNLTKTTDPLSRTTATSWNAFHQPLTIRLPSGRTRSFTYDGAGNQLTASATGPNESQTLTSSTAYDAKGQVISTTDPLQHTTTYAHNSAGDLISVTSPLGRKTTFAYDPISRMTSTVSARGNEPGRDPAAYRTSWTLDAVGRPTLSTDPLGRTSSTVYDPNGNVTSTTDPLGRKTSITYDAADQPTLVTLPDGSTNASSYDASGSVSSRTNGNGKITSYEHDLLDRVTAGKDPLGRSTRYAYNNVGNLTSVTAPSGRSTLFTYNTADELIGRQKSGQATDPITYDDDGLRTRFGDVYYAYDGYGRMTESAQLTASGSGSGGTTRYTYDAASRITALGYPTGAPAGLAVTNTYDNDDQLTAIDDGLGHRTSYTYDPDGAIATVTRPDGSTQTNTIDPAGQLTALTDKSTASNGFSYTATYSYSQAGELASADESKNTSGSNLAYTYTKASRLATNGFGASFAYDPAGNLTTKATPAEVLPGLGLGGLTSGTPSYDAITQTFDAADQLTQSAKGSSPRASYAYNTDGQRTSRTTSSLLGSSTDSYAYDAAGQLTSATTGGLTNTFAYDATGLRLNTSLLTTTIESWDRSSGIPLMITEGTTGYVYGADGLPLESIASNGDVRIYHHDHLGSTRALTDTTGKSVATYNYDAYGALQGNAQTAARTNPFLYRGEHTDASTGFIYLRARYYDPDTGQFLTRDPLEDATGDPYAYAGGDPINAADPTGLYPGEGFVKSATQALVNGAAGFGDGASFGLTRRLRKALGVDNIDPCSSFYSAAHTAGAATLSLAASETAGLALASRTAKIVQGGAGPVRIGQAGEAAVQAAYNIGPKATRVVNGRTRIFDGLNSTTLTEVKNVKQLSFTQQLKDSLAYAQANNLRFDLYVRGGANPTKLTGPLISEIQSGRITLKFIP